MIDASGSLTGKLPGRVRIGRIHTADAIVATPAEKRELFTTTSCLAVDMETEPARRFASERHATFLSVRAISDVAGDALDPALLDLIDNEGNPRIRRALAMLCCNPGKLRMLLHIQRASAMALTNLAAVVREILKSDWPDAATMNRHHA
ncbi:MAG TPA: hypothetical protein VM008_00555 [Phycisphaerae bacterium]|nr:hypothetical protein [Phycisphaerae bacterium]